MRAISEPARDALRQTILQRYAVTYADALAQEWFEHSGFANIGYWQNGAVTGVEASRALVRRLVEMVPPPARAGKVLDVACGCGATTKELTRYFGAGDVTAINIAADQLERAARLVPGATFREMDAASLDFPPDAFDVVVCVEAAPHFDTRTRFLAEAFRVLKPGGHLVLSDLLFNTPARLSKHVQYLLLKRLFGDVPRDYPLANLVATVEAYTDLLRVAGFDQVVVEDDMNATWQAFYRAHRSYLFRVAMSRPRLWKLVLSRIQTLAIWNAAIYAYPLVAARKPARLSADLREGLAGSSVW
jgi:ubiquinone/menaquinone biosynthesis C-methylase UbiE